jgi:phosphotransacetylase
MRIGMCELWDHRMKDVARQLERDRRRFEIVEADGVSDAAARQAVEFPHRPGEPTHRRAAYLQAVCDLRDRRTDVLIVGAQVALAEFLPLLFRALGTHREQSLLFSAAPVRGSHGKDRRFVFIDPCVVPNPSLEELAKMAKQALPIAEILFEEPGYACLLSHATGTFVSSSTEQQDAIAYLSRALGADQFCSDPLQLDAALSADAARKKLGEPERLPNVLLCPNISVANLLYKCLETFAREKVQLSGAILIGLESRFVGLIPRTVQENEVLLLVEHLLTLFRHETNH